jgi:transposase
VVSGLESVDPGPDLLDDRAALVTADDWPEPHQITGHQGLVGVAQVCDRRRACFVSDVGGRRTRICVFCGTMDGHESRWHSRALSSADGWGRRRLRVAPTAQHVIGGRAIALWRACIRERAAQPACQAGVASRRRASSASTVRRGVDELESGEVPLPVGRARRAGGGRRRVSAHDPDLVSALLALVEPDERGDPMSPLRWTTKSLRHLAEELTGQGHPVSAPTVGRLLRENGFSLQGTAKTLEGEQHPDRDAQFGYINEQVKAHQAAGEPVVSVDAKKKEQLGQLPAAGREWRPKGDPGPGGGPQLLHYRAGDGHSLRGL